MRSFSGSVVAFVAVTLALPVAASPFTEAEAQLRGAYGAYRAALFLSNQGKGPETLSALEKFNAAWDGLAAGWGQTPPPQYADDAGLPLTFQTVDGLIESATAQATAGDLAAAHETLEAVRDEVAALHARNGLIGFSDRMNDYHAAMEKVLTTEYSVSGAGAAAQLLADARLLDYLATQILTHPAPEADAAEYAPLMAGFVASVEAFLAAAEAGDVAATLAARGGLKPAYSKLFAKFG